MVQAKTKAAIALVVLLLLVGATLAILHGSRPRLNVILISIDTLRPDRMGVYGHRPMGLSTTPFLDTLAARSTVFTNATSTSSWTLPAHWALLTGVPDQVHGVVNDRIPLPEGLLTLAEILEGEGYITGGFFSGPYLDPAFGFARGFDVYESCIGADERRGTGRPPGAEDARRGAPRTRFRTNEVVTSRRVSDRGLEFIRKSRGEPFFLFLHYFDVHNDFLPPPPFDTRFGPPYAGWVNGRGVTSDPRYRADMASEDLDRLLALYDGEIGWVDRNLELLFDQIDRIDRAILENTVVIVTSDHGEEFFEKGRVGHRKHLYQCVVQIPLIVSCPGRVAAGRTVEDLVRIYDIVPTIADLAGIPCPGAVQGESLLDLLNRPAPDSTDSGSGRSVLLDLTQIPKENKFTRRTAFRLGPMKLISVQERALTGKGDFPSGGSLVSETHELYDLATDPDEDRDLSAEQTDLLRKMAAACSQMVVEMEDQARTVRSGLESGKKNIISEQMKKSLDELGYGGGQR